MSRRIVSCLLLDGRREAMPAVDLSPSEGKPRWLNRWQFQRNGKTITVAVEVYDKDSLEKREVCDARDFIERLTEFPEGAGFDIYCDEEDSG